MKGCKRRTLATLTLLLLLLFSATSVANAAEAVVVSEVRGLNDYVATDNSFIHGSTLKVYTEMEDVNYDGFAFVEFIFIIEDPKGHVVSMDSMEVNRRDYVDDVYVEYSKRIPSWWLYGKYKLDIYAYNRINKLKINELERKVEVRRSLEELFDNEDEFEDLEAFFESGSDADDMGVIKSFSDSRKERTSIRFSVCREEEIKEEAPPGAKVIEGTKFTITNLQRDKFTVKPDEPVTISVTVKNERTKGTEKVTLVINEEKEAEESVTLDRLASKTIHFTVKKSLPGQYKVTISGTDKVTQFFVEKSQSSGGAGNSTSALLSASASKVPEAEEPPNSGLPPIYVSCIGFAAMLVIIMHRFRSKQPDL